MGLRKTGLGVELLEARRVLAVNLTDGFGFLWDIQDDGRIFNGSSDAYDGGHDLAGFVGSPSFTLEDDGREVVIGPELNGAVDVTRKIYVPQFDGFARFLEVVTNNTGLTQNYTVDIRTNLGSDTFTEFLLTEFGLNTAFSTSDNWIITDDADGAGDPTIAHVISGNGGVNPSSVSTTAPGDDNVDYSYNLTLAPGETQIIMHFGVQANNRTDAQAKADSLEVLGSGALFGMSAAERAQVVNFDVPTLPADLVDGDGFLWDIQTNGSVSNGTIDAYDGGHVLSGFVGSANPTLEEDGREVVIGPESTGAVDVTRKIYVPEDDGFARFLEVVTNSTGVTQNYTVDISTDLGSDSGTEFLLTEFGLNTTFTALDNWIITDDADGTGDPTIAHVISGDGGVDPSSVSTTATGDDLIDYSFDLTLAPGETQIVMHFGVQANNRADAQARAEQLEMLENDALRGMSAIERSQVVNFDLEPDLAATFFNADSTGTDVVSAGDSITLDYTYENVGSLSVTSGQYDVGFYISTDMVIDTSDDLLGFDGGVNLAPGETDSDVRTVTLPGVNDSFWSSLGDGTYFIGMFVDDLSTLDESDEANNFLIDDIVVSGTQAPDLEATSFDADSTGTDLVSPGATISLDYVYENVGLVNVTPGQYDVGFYISTDTVIDTSDLLLTVDSGTTLAPGATDSDVRTVTLPGITSQFWSGGGDGTYYIGMFVDDLETLAEPDEANNFLIDDVVVTGTVILGDFDDDRDVDVDDFGVFTNSFLLSPQGGPPFAPGDFDEDGDVDVDDFGVFTNGFLVFPPTATAASVDHRLAIAAPHESRTLGAARSTPRPALDSAFAAFDDDALLLVEDRPSAAAASADLDSEPADEESEDEARDYGVIGLGAFA